MRFPVTSTGWPQRLTVSPSSSLAAMRQAIASGSGMNWTPRIGRASRVVDEEAAANRFAGAFRTGSRTKGVRRATILAGAARTGGAQEGLRLEHAGLDAPRSRPWISQSRYVEMQSISAHVDGPRPRGTYEGEPALFDQLVFRALAQDLISESRRPNSSACRYPNSRRNGICKAGRISDANILIDMNTGGLLVMFRLDVTFAYPQLLRAWPDRPPRVRARRA